MNTEIKEGMFVKLLVKNPFGLAEEKGQVLEVVNILDKETFEVECSENSELPHKTGTWWLNFNQQGTIWEVCDPQADKAAKVRYGLEQEMKRYTDEAAADFDDYVSTQKTLKAHGIKDILDTSDDETLAKLYDLIIGADCNV